MASPAVNVGTGCSIAFGTSSWTAQVLDIQWSGISRTAVETTHFGTTAAASGKFGSRTFMPGDLCDPGELTIRFNFNPDTLPPFDYTLTAAETVTLTVVGSTTPATWAGSGFAIGYDVSIPLEDVMVGTLRVKMTGNVTRTAGT